MAIAGMTTPKSARRGEQRPRQSYCSEDPGGPEIGQDRVRLGGAARATGGTAAGRQQSPPLGEAQREVEGQAEGAPGRDRGLVQLGRRLIAGERRRARPQGELGRLDRPAVHGHLLQPENR